MNAVALVNLFPPSGLTYNYKAAHTYIKTIRFEGKKMFIYPHAVPTALQQPFCSQGFHMSREVFTELLVPT